MNDRHMIADRLRKKEAEIQGLEDKLRVARIYVQALQDVMKLLDHTIERTSPTETLLKPGSTVAIARETILTLDRPVHMNELLKAQGKANNREARASLTSSLSAYVRRGEIFTRPAPNTFGLAELGHLEVATKDTEPPPDFGRQSPAKPSDLDEEIPF